MNRPNLNGPREPMISGYTYCACRDCFEVTVSDDTDNPDLCLSCKEAGCEPGKECQSPHAYGGEDTGCRACGASDAVEVEPGLWLCGECRVDRAKARKGAAGVGGCDCEKCNPDCPSCGGTGLHENYGWCPTCSDI